MSIDFFPPRQGVKQQTEWHRCIAYLRAEWFWPRQQMLLQIQASSLLPNLLGFPPLPEALPRQPDVKRAEWTNYMCVWEIMARELTGATSSQTPDQGHGYVFQHNGQSVLTGLTGILPTIVLAENYCILRPVWSIFWPTPGFKVFLFCF